MNGKPQSMQSHDTAPSGDGWLKKAPVLVITAVALTGAIFFRDQLSFETLAHHREALIGFRDAHYLATVAGFIAAYIAIVALSLPGGTVATLTGGFLFGLFPGVIFNVIGASCGAILIFLAVRHGFGDRLAQRVTSDGGKAAQMIAALRKNEWSVLFLMRLVPLVPFVLSNLIPAFVGTSLWRFAVSTCLGIIPGALVFTSVGSGLGEVFARGEKPDLGIIFTAPILVPILGLATLAALPMLLKAFRKGA
jgi:uncharacterized membrane protein YdjX (TVP38/TMEM64 family)